MKQLTTYLPDETYSTMTALSGEGESVNGYVRAAVEAENRRRLFAGMDQAISAAVNGDAEAAWHAANAAVVDTRDDAA
ncbi:MAG: hypothetical protein ACRDT2_20020 [Natronosporangium sp.]